jgi:hypothetical protein
LLYPAELRALSIGEIASNKTPKTCFSIPISILDSKRKEYLFATASIESGVDIATVSRWLGHKDGGALAMRAYGHLRDEHSQAMAAKVNF